ncbi:MAG: phosphoserine phosphatase SerB [Desulfobacterales bacterium]|nr:phosphoserine phosphatase SerB [Desulfobacterales bacterium]
MGEVILINITGKDKRRLTSTFTGIIAKAKANILDIGQSVIHDQISLGVLIEIPECGKSASILKNILFEGHKYELKVSFTPVNLNEYEAWITEQDKQRRILTLMGKNLSAKQVSDVCGVMSDHDINIDTINRLSERISLKKNNPDHITAIQIFVSGTPKSALKMREDIMNISKIAGIDVSFQIDDIYRKNRKLVVFDMDSTLIQTEVIDELAKIAGKEKEVSKITKLAMEGKMDFDESFKQRVALLKGITLDEIKKLPAKLPLSEGAERVTKILKRLGYKIAIISGGFTCVGEYLKEKLDLDYAFANELDIKDGIVTGKIRGEIINGEKKAIILRELAQRENLSLAQTIAVGDGANDLPMISIAGLGVAFEAKPAVKEKADSAISKVGLDGLLYLLGIHERELNE